MKKKVLKTFGLLLFMGFNGAVLAEDAVDLDSVADTPKPAATEAAGGSSGLKIMGRVDLTVEFTKKQTTDTEKEADLKSYHFLLFLRTKASDKVSFMGEFVNKSMYEISYSPRESLTMQFGKIVVPFGDTQYFHHFYGGVRGYGASGVMFPNIWAEDGVSVEYSLSSSEVNVYLVDGFSTTAANTPDFKSPSDGKNHAGGFRYTTRAIPGITGILSGYYEEYLPGKPVYLYGIDASSDYGAINKPIVKNFRINTGMAEGDVKKVVGAKDFKRTGNYLQLATNLIPYGEARFRIGAYVDDSRTKTVNDTHSFNLGWSMPIDVMKLLAEYQWNYEEKNEIDNDLFRVMLSLDF